MIWRQNRPLNPIDYHLPDKSVRGLMAVYSDKVGQHGI